LSPPLPPEEFPTPELPDDDRPPELLDDDVLPPVLEDEDPNEPPEDELPLRLPEDEDPRLNGPELSAAPPPSSLEPVVCPESPHATRTAMPSAEAAHTLRFFMLVSSLPSLARLEK
jgi:hypothetical protein